MANTTVSSVNVPIQLSFDGGTTWKTLVCLTQYNMPFGNTLNEVESFCGVHQGAGTTRLDANGEAIADLAPESTMVSLNDLVTAMQAKSTIQVRVVYPGTGSIGNLLYWRTEAKVENVVLKGATASLLMFDWSLKGEGIPDTTP